MEVDVMQPKRHVVDVLPMKINTYLVGKLSVHKFLDRIKHYLE